MVFAWVLTGAFHLAESRADEPQWRPMRGSELQRLLSDREFSDGAHFSYRFRNDGTFLGVDLGANVQGTWTTHRGQFCWSRTKPVEGEECYEVESSGENVRFLRFGSEAIFGTLSMRGDVGKRGEEKKR
jgi:hypothetical protein